MVAADAEEVGGDPPAGAAAAGGAADTGVASRRPADNPRATVRECTRSTVAVIQPCEPEVPSFTAILELLKNSDKDRLGRAESGPGAKFVPMTWAG